MRLIKLSIFSLIVLSLASCMKAKNDFGGLRTDPGSIVISIAEKTIINTDPHGVGMGYQAYTNFDFTSNPNEQVRFFTIRVSQPRDAKLNGDLRLKITLSPSPTVNDPDHLFGNGPNGWGRVNVPANAINVPAEVVIPASAASEYDYPVFFTVNKAALDPSNYYVARFTITGTNQGVISEFDKTVDIGINMPNAYLGDPTVDNANKFVGLYTMVSNVTDSANQYKAINNTQSMILVAYAPDIIGTEGTIDATRGVEVVNLLTGSTTTPAQVTTLPSWSPRFKIDANGNVTAIYNNSNSVVASNATLQSGKFTYTSNDKKSFAVSYTVRITSTINGVSVTRPVTVTQTYTYAPLQYEAF